MQLEPAIALRHIDPAGVEHDACGFHRGRPETERHTGCGDERPEMPNLAHGIPAKASTDLERDVQRPPTGTGSYLALGPFDVSSTFCQLATFGHSAKVIS